jgi:hypothetical protein
VIVQVGNVKPFSDIQGRHVVRLNNDAARRKEIADRLRTAGCSVDESGDDWLSVGNFELQDDQQYATAEEELEATLLAEIKAPGLEILTAIAEAGDEVTVTSKPVPQIVRGTFDYDNPGRPQHALPYDWSLVDVYVRLLRDRRLIRFRTVDARGGFGGVALEPLGEFLLRHSVPS